MPEEHDGGPVVGEVFGEGACRAGSLLTNVALHGRVKRVATDDLVEMGRGNSAGLDERVETLNAHSRAAEPEGSLGRRHERRGEGKPLHCVSGLMSRL